MFDFYNDMVFDDILVQPVLTLCIKFVGMLNSIPLNKETKYKMPFSECFFSNTHNLQRSLRRALFKNLLNEENKKEKEMTQEILKFFERLEVELPGVNLLQKNVTSSYKRAQNAF